MIDQENFKSAWALLCERFNRTPSRPLMLAYYRSLSPRMSTEQFQKAASRVFDSSEFFPKPDDFIEAGLPDPKESALEQWEVVQELMSGEKVGDRLTPEARRVVQVLGGEYELRMTQLDRVPFVRKDFLALYGDTVEVARRERPQLVESTTEGDEVAAAALKGPQAVIELAERRKGAA